MAGFMRLLKPLSSGSFQLFRFILRNWYFVILFLVLIPTITSSVTIAIQQHNPTIPFIQLGVFLANSDAQISKDVQTLQDNPIELIKMEKPEAGIWNGVKYKWAIFKVVLKEMGLIWAIFFPFIIIYKILRHRNQSESGKNFFLTCVYGFVFIFIVNLIMIINGFVSGTLVSAAVGDLTQYESAKLIIIQALPFHGLVSLLVYLISTIR